MFDWLLTLDIIDGPAPWLFWGVTALLVLVLLVRKWTRRRVLRAASALAVGVVLGFALSWSVDAFDVFQVPMPAGVMGWTISGLAIAAFGIQSLWDSHALRKVVAVAVVCCTLLSAGLGINAAFGIDRNLGDLLEISTLQQVQHLQPPRPGQAPVEALYRTWHAPAGMPAKGEVRQLSGSMRVPSSAGFAPRDAAIYLPPAALVADAPDLPVVVLMMGLPGNPTPTAAKTAADAFAASHDGLAPIIIVADQLGSSRQNPGCANSQAFGGVDTYFNVDIPTWIRTHLRVLPGPANWTISGYSNGGACSFLYAAHHPDIWGSMVSISGEEYPGMESPEPVLTKVFDNDQAAFDANKPEDVL